MSRYELRCIAYTINAINYAMLTYSVHASIVSCSSLSSLTTVYMLIAARQRCVVTSPQDGDKIEQKKTFNVQTEIIDREMVLTRGRIYSEACRFW